jgi:hypothetical protein
MISGLPSIADIAARLLRSTPPPERIAASRVARSRDGGCGIKGLPQKMPPCRIVQRKARVRSWPYSHPAWHCMLHHLHHHEPVDDSSGRGQSHVLDDLGRHRLDGANDVAPDRVCRLIAEMGQEHCSPRISRWRAPNIYPNIPTPLVDVPYAF